MLRSLESRSGDLRAPRIAIATSGRFHVLDLARELAQLGFNVTLYSMLPAGRAARFGLEKRHHRSLLPLVAPVVVWERLAPRLAPEKQSWIAVRAFDEAVTWLLRPCDVFICMSGIFVRAAVRARRAYDAQIWLERGSHHIQTQGEILGGLSEGFRPHPDIVERELIGYREADRIVVPSRHVAESFERDPVAARKLFVNPYGTSLEMFPQVGPASRLDRLALIFVGTWSRRKGCDVLERVIRASEGVVLRHVGRIGDYQFPTGDPRFEHCDAVDQIALAPLYGAAHAFVHASPDEGLSVVQAQSLAAGLPLICTDRTGGADLAHTPALRARITVVPHDDEDALREAILALRDAVRDGRKLPLLSDEDRKTLSWSAYARRYADELAKSLSAS